MKRLFLVFILPIAYNLLTTGCQKIEYTTMESPAYLRVFNSLSDLQLMGSGGDSLSYLCMLINPEFDAKGTLTGAEVVGDFLDKREAYAPPYPSHIGVSTTVNNPEYPGKEAVLAGPVLNGFDLSSWAQVPSGKLRFMFMYRPKSEVPFLSLEERYKNRVFADTTLTLSAGEVYTLQALLKDFTGRQTGLLLRQEIFYKQAFSDSTVYVNFYNYSAKGFYQAPDDAKIAPGRTFSDLFQRGIRDTMNIYLSLFKSEEYTQYNVYGDTYDPRFGVILQNDSLVGEAYDRRFLGVIQHDGFSGAVMPYYGFPLWTRDSDNGIHTGIWERFYFLAPELDIKQHAYSEEGINGSSSYTGGTISNTRGNFAVMNCLLDGRKIYIPSDNWWSDPERYNAGANVPNLVVNTHSGQYNPRSFATVNTVEVINGKAYLTTVQRRYAPPVY
ncbi:MAG: hypothetical protein KF862_14955 [Chitinophagaceae bacterium]|nr:hypothetical protein [Chitinophagaceae bacterium]